MGFTIRIELPSQTFCEGSGKAKVATPPSFNNWGVGGEDACVSRTRLVGLTLRIPLRRFFFDPSTKGWPAMLPLGVRTNSSPSFAGCGSDLSAAISELDRGQDCLHSAFQRAGFVCLVDLRPARAQVMRNTCNCNCKTFQASSRALQEDGLG